MHTYTCRHFSVLTNGQGQYGKWQSTQNIWPDQSLEWPLFSRWLMGLDLHRWSASPSAVLPSTLSRLGVRELGHTAVPPCHSLALVMLPSSMAKSPRSSPSVQASRTGQCTVMPRKKKWGDCQGSWIFCCSCFLKAFLCNHAVPFYWFRVPVATVLTEYSPVLRTAVIGGFTFTTRNCCYFLRHWDVQEGDGDERLNSAQALCQKVLH